jgi:hypothetical protein
VFELDEPTHYLSNGEPKGSSYFKRRLIMWADFFNIILSGTIAEIYFGMKYLFCDSGKAKT